MDWNSKILGHKKQLQQLEKMAKKNILPNALLFMGPGGIGKYRIARNFAQLLNHEYSEIVREIEKNISSEVVTLGDLWQMGTLEDWGKISKTSNFDQNHRMGGDGESPRRTNTIGVRDVHEFVKPLSNFGRGSWKVAIMRDAHRMTNESANALLKILEEPPENTLFILTVNHEKNIPDTIRSRCQGMTFSLLSRNILHDYLKNFSFSDEQIKEMLTISQGRSEHLFRLMEDSDFFYEEQEQFQEIARFFFSKDPLYRMKMAEKLSASTDALPTFLDNFLRFLRSLLVEKASHKELDIANSLSYEQILFLLSILSETFQGIRMNANKRLLLERLFFALPN